MSRVKKVSVAGVFGKIKLERLMGEKQYDVMRLIGRCVNSKVVPTPYGESTALLGEFEATNPETGEVSESSTAYLPDIALTPILTALAGSQAVDFAIMVGVRFAADDAGHKSGGSVYEYTFRPLLSVAADNPILRIKAAMAAQGETDGKAALEAQKGEHISIAAATVIEGLKVGSKKAK